MKLLALDTATEACSAAVLVEGKVFEHYQLAPRRHAALILPMIDTVLAEAGLSVTQLDAIAFGRGPGAFTGVRVAVSVTQGIAFASDLPVIPVSTLAALASGVYQKTGHSHVAVALDARMKEVYWGAYHVVGGIAECVGQESVCSPEAVPMPLASDWFGAGSGWTTYAEVLAKQLVVNGWLGDCYPHAADVARLAAGLQKQAGNHGVQAEQALPIYLRNEVVKKSA